MLIFAEKNPVLRQLFQEKFGEEIQVVDDMFSVSEPKYVVTCSNPWLSMGAGIDAAIKARYPDECIEPLDHPISPGSVTLDGNSRVIYAVTVDTQLKANPEAIKNILFQLLLWSKSLANPIVFTGMGCGIGGLSYETFIQLFAEVYAKNQA